jgi:protein-tyrosine-phosphatase
LRARKVVQEDFAAFDYILATGNGNLLERQRAAPPRQARPVHGDEHRRSSGCGLFYRPEGLEQILDRVEERWAGLLAALNKKLGR